MRSRGGGDAAGAAQPRHSAHRAIGQRSVVAIESMEAAHELRLETVDLAAYVHKIATQSVVGEIVNRLLSEPIHCFAQGIRRGRRQREHDAIVPKQLFGLQ
jgi:hypothetical protein